MMGFATPQDPLGAVGSAYRNYSGPEVATPQGGLREQGPATGGGSYDCPHSGSNLKSSKCPELKSKVGTQSGMSSASEQTRGCVDKGQETFKGMGAEGGRWSPD